MGAALKPMTLDAFLAWEARQELRYEFDGFHPVAMTGGSSDHAFIQVNIIAALSQRLRGRPCRVVGSELKIRVANSIRYPDAFVVCSPVPRGTQVITDPVVVFEVLSPSTPAVNRIQKNREYRLTPSILRYVILEQDTAAATVFSRAGDTWVSDVLVADGVLEMEEIGVSVPLSEIYEGVEFPPDEEDAASA